MTGQVNSKRNSEALMELVTLILIIAFALLFNMANGWNDAANSIATVVSTRVLSPVGALLFGAVLNLLGALASSEVAKTVGSEIALEGYVTPATFLAAVVMAPIWITWCSRRGLPNSCSHALLGALVGSVIATCGGFHGLNPHGIGKIALGVFVAPIAGFVLGYLIVRVVTWLFHRVRPSVGTMLFGKLQLVSAASMAFAHGTGDAQKAMGIIAGALMTYNISVHGASPNTAFSVDLWIKLACAVTMAIGTSVGGWAVMRTLGSRLAHLRTYQGFSAETAAAVTVMVNTFHGVPMSTTHSITGAILGVGTERGVKMVRWGVGKKIVFAWIVTFPVCIVAGAIVNILLRLIGFH